MNRFKKDVLASFALPTALPHRPEPRQRGVGIVLAGATARFSDAARAVSTGAVSTGAVSAGAVSAETAGRLLVFGAHFCTLLLREGIQAFKHDQ